MLNKFPKHLSISVAALLILQGCAGFKLRRSQPIVKKQTIIVDKATTKFWQTLRKDNRFNIEKTCNNARCLKIFNVSEHTEKNAANFSNYINFNTTHVSASFNFIDKNQKALLTKPRKIEFTRTSQLNNNTLLAEKARLEKDRSKLYKKLLNHIVVHYHLNN